MILFVDDSDDMGHFVKGLEDLGIRVEWASNFYDAIDSLDDDPGEDAYSAVVLDLAMSSRGLPDEAMELADQVFSGWAFYKCVLKHYPRLQENTIFLSGSPENFMERVGDEIYRDLNVVTKGYNDIDSVAEILSRLNIYIG